MRYLTIEELELLKYIADSGYVSADDVTNYFDFSIRKIQTDIKEINATLEERSFPFSIKNDRKLGYYVETSDQKKLIEVLCQLNRILENSLLKSINKNQRVSMIARELLLEDDYIKSEDLADILNVSNPTLSLDLKEVRELIMLYELDLVSRPYYGLKIEGLPMNQLSMLLDLFDFIGIKPEDSLYNQEVLKQMNIEFNQYIEYKNKLHKLLVKHNVYLTTTGFNRIINLLFILDNDKFNDIDLIEIKDLAKLKEYKVAEELREDNTNLLTYYILSNIDVDTIITHESHHILYTKSLNIFEELRKLISHEINLNLDGKKNSFLAFFIKYTIRKNFNIFEYNTLTSMIDAVVSKPATQSVAIKIFTLIKPKNLNIINETIFYELSIMIYNIAYVNTTDYEQIYALIVSDFGTHSGLSIIEHLNLTKFDIEYDIVASHMFSTKDLQKYDFIVNTSNIYHIETVMVPVFNTHYFVKEQIDKSFWSTSIMQKRKENHILKQLKNVKTFDLKATSVTIISQIYEILLEYDIEIKDYFEYVSYYFKNLKGWVSKKEIDIILYTHEDVCNSVFIFNLKEKIEINFLEFNKINLFIINPKESFLSIKQMDSTIAIKSV